MRLAATILLFPVLLFAGNDSLMKIFSTSGSLSERIRAASQLCYRFEMEGQKDSALKYGRKLLELARKNKDRQGIGDFYNYMGRTHYYVQSYDSAEFYFSRAAEEYQAAGFIRGVASAYNNRAAICSETDQMKKSIREHLRLAEFSRKNGLSVSEGDAYTNLGYCYMTIYSNDSAIHYFVKASRIYERFNEYTSLTTAYYNLATINTNLKLFTKGLEYLEKVSEIARKGMLKPNMNNYVLALKATIFEGLNMPDSASAYIDKAIESCIQTEDKLSLCTVYNHKGDILFREKKTQEALAFYKKALDIAMDIKSEPNVEQSYTRLGNINTEQKNSLRPLKIIFRRFRFRLGLILPILSC